MADVRFYTITTDEGGHFVIISDSSIGERISETDFVEGVLEGGSPTLRFKETFDDETTAKRFFLSVYLYANNASFERVAIDEGVRDDYGILKVMKLVD